MTRYHGISTETVKRFLIDAGAVYVNYGETSERLLGATRGGNQFVVEQDVKEIEMDGAKGPVKGARRIVEVRARIVANLLELTAENLKLALAGSNMADYPTSAGKTHDKITRNRDIVNSDYVTNVALVGNISGADNPFVGIIKNALAVENMELSTEAREEGVLEVTFEGHFDPSNLDAEPWEIRFPVIESGS